MIAGTDPTPITVNVAAPILAEWIFGTIAIGAVAIGIAVFVTYMVCEQAFSFASHEKRNMAIAMTVTALATIIIVVISSIVLYGIEWERYRRITGKG